MKIIKIIFLISFCASGLFAADQKPAPAPTFTDAQKVEILQLSIQRHQVQEQIDQVQIRFLQQQVSASNSYSTLQSKSVDLSTQLDQKVSVAGIDKTKFDVDFDTGEVKEKPKPPKTADKESPPK